MRRTPIPVLLLALAVAACSSSSHAPAGTATGTATNDPTANAAFATPQLLPVTPVTIAYVPRDPRLTALDGARIMSGTYSGGLFEIEVPTAWNGSVVYFAHGFRANPPDLTITPPPLRAYFIQHGYAWAASTYSKNGYEPGVGANDTYALRLVVEEKLGAPKHSYLYGQSMGGHVIGLILEEHPTDYDGALSECGAVAGPAVIDFFTDWGVLSSYLSGVELINAVGDVTVFGPKIKDKVVPALGPPDSLTKEGKAFADAILRLTGGPRPFFREGFQANYNFNFALLVNAVGAAGPATSAAQNLQTQYHIAPGFGVSEAELNRGVSRIKPAPAYTDAALYPEFAPMTGKIQRPLLTLHGTGDLFVPISMEQSYRRTVDAAGNGDLLVQRAIRRSGHCTFSDQERQRGFEDLVAWAGGGPKPGGDDLLGDLTDIGRQFTTPLAADDPGGTTP